MAVRPAVTVVLVHISAMRTLTESNEIEYIRGEIVFLSPDTAILLYHSAMEIWTACNVVSTG